MKKILCLILAVLMCALTLTACNEKQEAETSAEAQTHIAPAKDEIDMTEIDSLDGVTDSDEPTDYVLLTIENYGEILIRLYPDVAPVTVANFKKLVSEGFYDGLIFHRVIQNFMIQGGDPDGNGTGGSSETIYGEFANNGFENNLSHKRGVVAMARNSISMDSASSQFYICHKTSGVAQLDGDYATFGYVIYGIEVVDKIAKVNTNSNDKPLKNIVISSAKFVTLP